MELGIKDQLFIVGGATSGLGKAISHMLLEEGARIVAIARTKSKLEKLKNFAPERVAIVAGDLSSETTLDKILETIGDRQVHGAVINSGGPPTMSVLETTMENWDAAYQNVVRWKILLTKKLIPLMKPYHYGRLLYIESVTVKVPLENMVLSNAMRLAMVGFVKTLSQEIGNSGITLNILGPGYHETQRMVDLFKKNSEIKNISVDDVKAAFKKQTAVGALGDPKEFASLACWFLAPVSKYITGQTVSVDGGLVKGTMG